MTTEGKYTGQRNLVRTSINYLNKAGSLRQYNNITLTVLAML